MSDNLLSDVYFHLNASTFPHQVNALMFFFSVKILQLEENKKIGRAQNIGLAQKMYHKEVYNQIYRSIDVNHTI